MSSAMDFGDERYDQIDSVTVYITDDGVLKSGVCPVETTRILFVDGLSIVTSSFYRPGAQSPHRGIPSRRILGRSASTHLKCIPSTLNK
jgi:hypothetical protein